LNKEDVCTKIQLDIEKPEKSEYTFGLPVESLTDSNASAKRKNKRSSDHMHRWLKETENSFEVKVEALNSRIDLQAETINMKADKTDIEGYVKMGDDVDVGSLLADSINSATISGDTVSGDTVLAGELIVGGSALVKQEKYIVTNFEVTTYDGYVTGIRPITDKITYYE
jgi:hypothetical protein